MDSFGYFVLKYLQGFKHDMVKYLEYNLKGVIRAKGDCILPCTWTVSKFIITCRFKRCATDSSSLNDLSCPRLLEVMFILGEYLPFSPCIPETLSLYSCSVLSANSASSRCLKDFSELRSLSLKRIIAKFYQLWKVESGSLWSF